MENAERYIRRIRNTAKQEYAWRVLGCWGREDPVRPVRLGVMGAQAVRMELARILNV